MHKILIFGNSGSGKSTLSKELSKKYTLPHLDLDILAWEAKKIPVRKPIVESKVGLDLYLNEHNQWVIEGCYSDLLSLVIPFSSEIIFLNPGDDTCIENCKNRPWEQHKYASPKQQDDKLEMLLVWVKKYSIRNDEFSLKAHRELFDAYPGKKTEYNSNERNG